MGLSMGHLVLLLIIVLVVFGAGKIPQIMGDVAKGMRAFKKGMNEGDDITPTAPSHQKEHQTSSVIIDHDDYGDSANKRS